MIDVEERARQLLDAFGLTNWHFEWGEFDHAGECDYQNSAIVVSRAFAEVCSDAPDLVTDTLLHEIAHALVGPDVEDHGVEWTVVAIAIGANSCNEVDEYEAAVQAVREMQAAARLWLTACQPPWSKPK